MPGLGTGVRIWYVLIPLIPPLLGPILCLFCKLPTHICPSHPQDVFLPPSPTPYATWHKFTLPGQPRDRIWQWMPAHILVLVWPAPKLAQKCFMACLLHAGASAVLSYHKTRFRLGYYCLRNCRYY